MAATHLSKCSFVLALALFLAAIASAEYYNPTAINSEEAGAVVKPQDKPDYHNGYVSTPAMEKLKSRMHQYKHGWKQEDADSHRPESGNGYGSKSEKPLVPEAVKPKVSSEKRASNYGAKPEDWFPIGIEGVVACKSGSDYRPLQGAVVRITCSGEEEEHKVSCSTDEKGYFYKTMPAYGGKPELCKAFLEKSGSEKCSEPTDVNKGINGAALSSYKILHGKRIKLYPVGPFFYSMKTTTATTHDADDHPATAISTAKPYSKSPAGY
ncbi:unnamed protein product [Linum tenue]|uniref:Uncharacterized protein n=1 Tax=Linum tenue TaxID=586396 RepID=A0AAV0M3P6_9ROSI|nr:unnamed protein product [Linum tenue]